MIKSTQAQEPWSQGSDNGDDIIIEDVEGFVIFRCKSGASVNLNLHSPKRLHAFQRTVDCVNACAGINPAALPDLIDASTAMLDTWGGDDEAAITAFSDKVRAVVAKPKAAQ